MEVFNLFQPQGFKDNGLTQARSGWGCGVLNFFYIVRV